MNGIDPKWVFWLGVVIVIEQGIGSGTASLTHVIPGVAIPYVQGWCTLLAWIGTIVMTGMTGYSSSARGPLISAPTLPPGVKALIAFFVIAMALVFSMPAMAQPKAKTPAALPLLCDPLKLIPGCAAITATGPATSTGDLWQRLLAVAAPDLAYAKALADAAATPGSKLRSMCIAAIVTANSQAAGATLKNPDGTPMTPPNPDIITKLEQAAELIDNLQLTSPVMSGCAAAAVAAGQDVVTFLTTLLAGVAIVPK